MARRLSILSRRLRVRTLDPSLRFYPMSHQRVRGERSQFANFFDLKLHEAISHTLLSLDGYNLRGVLCKLRVD
jgi:hypothetical protein